MESISTWRVWLIRWNWLEIPFPPPETFSLPSVDGCPPNCIPFPSSSFPHQRQPSPFDSGGYLFRNTSGNDHHRLHLPPFDNDSGDNNDIALSSPTDEYRSLETVVTYSGDRQLLLGL